MKETKQKQNSRNRLVQEIQENTPYSVKVLRSGFSMTS